MEFFKKMVGQNHHFFAFYKCRAFFFPSLHLENFIPATGILYSASRKRKATPTIRHNGHDRRSQMIGATKIAGSASLARRIATTWTEP